MKLKTVVAFLKKTLPSDYKYMKWQSYAHTFQDDPFRFKDFQYHYINNDPSKCEDFKVFMARVQTNPDRHLWQSYAKLFNIPFVQ